MTEFITALSTGAIYAIVALACNVIFTVSKVFNFAQAYILMLCAFAAFQFGNAMGLPFWALIIVCAIVGMVVGALEEIIAIRWLTKHPQSGSHNELVTTLGFGLALSGLVILVWGSEPRALAFWTGEPVIEALGGRFLLSDLLIIAVAIAVAIGLGVFSRTSMVGLAGMATSQDRAAAQLRGINVTWLALGAFILAGAIVGAAAPVIAAKTYAVASLANALAVKSFIVLAIGGMGSQRGALIGGAVLGLVEVYGARYVGSDWRDIIVFAFMLIVLVALPKGIFARRSERVV